MNAVQGITSVPEAWEEQARELIPAYILYGPNYYTGIREGICSRCGHRFSGDRKRLEYPGDAEFRRGRHGDVIDCPGCGARAVMKARGRFRSMKSLAGNVRAVFCEAITPKKVRLRAFYIEWGFHDYNAVRPDLDFHEDFFMDLEPGKAEAYAGMKGVIADAERENEGETADNLRSALVRLVKAIGEEWKS